MNSDHVWIFGAVDPHAPGLRGHGLIDLRRSFRGDPTAGHYQGRYNKKSSHGGIVPGGVKRDKVRKVTID